jgi:hypothetical protein
MEGFERMLNLQSFKSFKGFIAGVVSTILLTTSLFTFADMQKIDAFFNDIKIKINGKLIDTGNDKPFVYNGRTYVPARYLCEGLGATVKWNESSNTVEVDNNKVQAVTQEVISVTVTPTPTVTPTVTPTPTPTKPPYPSSSGESTSNGFTFRKVQWGMNKDQIVQAEGKKPDKIEHNDLYVYKNISINSISSDILYVFNSQNQLCEVVLFSRESHVNKNAYIDDYDRMVNTITTKYGASVTNTPNWKNDLYKDDPQDWGMAVSCGHLSYLASWKLSDTTIDTLLTGDNFKIDLTVLFNSKNHQQRQSDSGM